MNIEYGLAQLHYRQFNLYNKFVQQDQKTSNMSQYDHNMDINDIYSLFNYSQLQHSQLLSFHPQSSLQILKHIPQNNQQLKNKQDQITQDKKYQNNSQSQSKNNFNLRPRIKMLDLDIQVEKRYELIRQGSKDDTVELNINFKTIIYKFLKELMLANELEPEEYSKIDQFGIRSPSFKSLVLLCNNKIKASRISKILTNFVKSSMIIRKIMESRCKMLTKIQMIKFVQILKFNVNGSGHIIRWKELYK